MNHKLYMQKVPRTAEIGRPDATGAVEEIFLEYHYSKRVVCIWFSFGGRNTFTVERVKSLVQFLDCALSEPSVRCIVFASALPNFFSDGFSLNEMFSEMTAEELQKGESPRYDQVSALYRRVIECPVPTISFVDGLCRGAGL